MNAAGHNLIASDKRGRETRWNRGEVVPRVVADAAPIGDSDGLGVAPSPARLPGPAEEQPGGAPVGSLAASRQGPAAGATSVDVQLRSAFPGVVVTSTLSEFEIDCVSARAELRRRPTPLPRSQANRDLLESWGWFLEPDYGSGQACNLTGTYSDDYGYSHGLMLARNVIKDFQRFRRSIGRSHEAACIGVEHHPSTNRAILHFHALISGDWTEDELKRCKADWSSRGWAVAQHVDKREGCIQYAAKHLLKQGSDDNFFFWSPEVYVRSRYERRMGRCGQARRVGGAY